MIIIVEVNNVKVNNMNSGNVTVRSYNFYLSIIKHLSNKSQVTNMVILSFHKTICRFLTFCLVLEQHHHNHPQHHRHNRHPKERTKTIVEKVTHMKTVVG